MASIWRKTGDNLKNGTILGVLFGFLIASSSIVWIQSLITTVVNFIPLNYHFQYIEYFIMASIGGVIGYFVDRR